MGTTITAAGAHSTREASDVLPASKGGAKGHHSLGNIAAYAIDSYGGGIRSNFAATTAPSSPAPVAGQLWYKSDSKTLNQYRGNAFVEIGALGPALNTTALRSIDAAANVADGQVIEVLGNSSVGDCRPFRCVWDDDSTATHDGVLVFRPTAGAAATGDGRWLRVSAVDSEATISAAATVNLAATHSDNVLVDGSYYSTGYISALGTLPAGVIRILRFNGKNRLVQSSSLELTNWGNDLIVDDGDIVTVRSRGSGNWTLIAHKTNKQLWRDRTPSGGAFHYLWAVGPDATTNFPYLALDGGYSRSRVLIRGGVHLSDIGDGVDFAGIVAAGTASSPTRRAAPHRIVHFYGWSWDETAYAPPKPGGIGGGAPYTGRSGNISIAILDTPEQYSRGGAILFGACLTGGDASDPQIVPYEHGWMRDNGLVLPGLATVAGPTGRAGVDGDARVSAGGARITYPFEYGGAAKNINSPGYVNWADVKPQGNLHLIASDHAKGFYALCFRMEDGITNGWDWGVDQTNDYLMVATVASGTRTNRIAYDASGNVFPITTGGPSHGKSTNRWSSVFSNTINANGSTSTSAAVAFFKNASESYEGNVVDLRADRSQAVAYNFIYCGADDNGTPAETFKVNGHGRVSIKGNQVVAERVTGFTTAAGTANKDASGINVGAITATDGNLQAVAAWVKSLHDAAAAHGLIGA